MDYGAAVSQRGYDVKTCADRFLVYSSAFRTLKINASYYVSGPTPNNNSGNVSSINTGTDTFTDNAHGMVNGELVNFTADSMPGGVGSWDDGYFYYIVNRTANTFQISETPGGSVVNVTSSGTNVIWYTDTTKIVINHNIGYMTPWIFVWNGIDASLSESIFMSFGLNSMPVRIYENSTEIYLTTDFASPGETYYFTCYQFIDTFDSYTSAVINTDTSSGASSNDHGLRVSKDGFDVKTCDDKDCVLSSSFYTSIIQKRGTDTTGAVAHSLGYIPSFLAFLKPDGKSYLTLASDIVSVSSTTLSSSLTGSDTLYYVIFKNKNV